MLHLSFSALRFSYIIALLVLGLGFCSLRPAKKTVPYCFDILHGSKLYLEGSSNVNTFTCDCETLDDLAPLRLGMEVDHQQNQAMFESARLKIKAESLDCGHKGINRDMYESLKSDQHPYISIELEDAHLPLNPAFQNGRDWVQIQACAVLTVAGVSRKVDLAVKAKKAGKNTYRFLSKHSINMTDYQIQPPSVMFGAIKVNNQIDINFDLLVEAE